MTAHEHGELLSALLDGEVSGEERARAEELLATDPTARVEYESLADVRRVLRGLPPVDAPFGFYERMLRGATPTAVSGRRTWTRSPAAVLSLVAASAAVWLVVAGIVAPQSRVRPPLDDVAAARTEISALTAASAPIQFTGGGAHFRPTDDVDDLGAVPGYAMGAAATGSDGVLAIYTASDGSSIAVFRQRGDVDWESLPDGERGSVDGVSTWRDLTTEGPLERVIVTADGTIYTLVGTVPADELIAVGRRLPPAPDDGFIERVRDACDELVDSLSAS